MADAKSKLLRGKDIDHRKIYTPEDLEQAREDQTAGKTGPVPKRSAWRPDKTKPGATIGVKEAFLEPDSRDKAAKNSEASEGHLNAPERQGRFKPENCIFCGQETDYCGTISGAICESGHCGPSLLDKCTALTARVADLEEQLRCEKGYVEGLALRASTAEESRATAWEEVKVLAYRVAEMESELRNYAYAQHHASQRRLADAGILQPAPEGKSEVAKLRARVAELEDRLSPQPIGTCPVDGTDILLGYEDGPVTIGCYNHNPRTERYEFIPFSDATHWWHLPGATIKGDHSIDIGKLVRTLQERVAELEESRKGWREDAEKAESRTMEMERRWKEAQGDYGRAVAVMHSQAEHIRTLEARLAEREDCRDCCGSLDDGGAYCVGCFNRGYFEGYRTPEWQPIETAPVNKLLLGYKRFARSYLTGNKAYLEANRATHWQPLPAGPAGPEVAGA